MQSLVGCQAVGNISSQPVESQHIDKWGISLSTKKVTATGLTLVIAQAGGEPTGQLEYGSDFSLEIFNEGAWEAVPYVSNPVWAAVACVVPMDETVEVNIAWDRIYGTLSAGTYRVCKDIMDFRGAGDYDTDTYYADFKVK